MSGIIVYIMYLVTFSMFASVNVGGYVKDHKGFRLYLLAFNLIGAVLSGVVVGLKYSDFINN